MALLLKKDGTPVNPNANILYLHPKQMEVFSTRVRFKVVVAGRRWGKTQLAKVAIIKNSRVANRLVWYVAPSYRMAKQIMWPELMRSIPKRWIYKINETNLEITLVNMTRIQLKGADNPDSLRGVGIHYLVLDEFQDVDPDAWKLVLRPTLASTGGEAMFIGTPKSYNYLYDLYMLGQNPQNIAMRRWKSWQFPTITSPFIPEAEILAAKADMHERDFRQEFEASFETMSGRVYYPFDRHTHVGEHAFNPKLPIWVGQDFNLDPMSTAIAQPQENGELWVVDEISLKGSNTEEVASEIERRFWRWKQDVVVFPDPASQYGQHARGETDLDVFRQKGFRRLKYHKKHPLIADRVNSVNRMLMTATGKVRMRVDRKCENVIESLEQTLYKEGGREIDKDADIEHMTDALGYLVEYQYPAKQVHVAGISL